MPAMAAQASPASLVANVIYTAATDGSDQLRYIAGEDARALLQQRQQFDDAAFMQGIKAAFPL
jgi:hypothetical protein